MSLSDKQSEFLQDFARLILFAHEQGFKLTAGELLRTEYQQAEYFRTGKSKTMNSDHLQKLAGDLNIFWKGKYIASYSKEEQMEIVKPLAEYWHSLHSDNYCGYDWGWDFPHFGRG